MKIPRRILQNRLMEAQVKAQRVEAEHNKCKN